VITFSVRNQLRYKGNLVRHVRKDEKRYYTELLTFSRQSLMLYPYHLSDVIVRGLYVTPFQYYSQMLEELMAQERSYDSLPNFTAADCEDTICWLRVNVPLPPLGLRLMGIGRNQYIDLINQSRSGSRKLGGFLKRLAVASGGKNDLLPERPVETLAVQPWWMIQVGYVTEDDMKASDRAEHALIDQLIDDGACLAGSADHSVVVELYRRGLVFFDVPVEDDDHVSVPPLEGFVMNRVLGDYLETLLYKIFVSIDESTTVGELAAVLEIEPALVRDAVSLYCRLGFARRKNAQLDSNDLHPSWYDHVASASLVNANALLGGGRAGSISSSEDEDDSLLRELNKALEAEGDADSIADETRLKDQHEETSAMSESSSQQPLRKKIAFLYDSALTAYLMMGNLSPGLKNHAVTMFEVGKLTDESLDSLVAELERVPQGEDGEGEGEAAKYFDHALALRETVLFLRRNAALAEEEDDPPALDLVRCESLRSLDEAAVARLLSKNYCLLVSMAPLSNEIKAPEVTSGEAAAETASTFPPHLGPAVPEVASPWFKLFLYGAAASGPPSLFLPKGCRLRRLPPALRRASRLLVTTWGHEPSEVPAATGALAAVLDALQHSPVLVQGVTFGECETRTKHVPFPADQSDPCVDKLSQLLDLEHACGYVTLVDLPDAAENKNSPVNGKVSEDAAELLAREVDSLRAEGGGDNNVTKRPTDLFSKSTSKVARWLPLDVSFGVPLFDASLNKEVCKRIISKGLWKKDSLDELTSSCHKLRRDLLAFIDQHGGSPPLSAETQSSSSPSVPMPTRSVYFDGSALRSWPW